MNLYVGSSRSFGIANRLTQDGTESSAVYIFCPRSKRRKMLRLYATPHMYVATTSCLSRAPLAGLQLFASPIISHTMYI